MTTKQLEAKVLEAARKYYSHLNSDEEILAALANEYGKEALHGYLICDYSPLGELSHIERIDILEVFDSDIEAAKQAEKDGIKLIGYHDQPKRGDYKYCRYLDTPKNRELIAEILKVSYRESDKWSTNSI